MAAAAGSANFHVAYIEFRVCSPDCPLSPLSDRAYLSFEGPARPGGWQRIIDILVRLAPPPVEDGWQPLFDAGETWRLDASGDQRRITLAGGNPRETLWSAVLDRDGGRVTVHCSERLVRHGPEGDRLENPVHYPLDQLLLFRALGDRGVLVHAAGAVVHGRGVLLTGVSGAGKTTISRVLDGHGAFRVLSDDRVVVTAGEGGFIVHGTPWPGEGGFARDEAAPLAACLFLRKGAVNRLHPLPAAEGLRALLPVASIFWPEPDTAAQTLSFCQALTAVVPAFDYSFTPGPDAAEFLAHQQFP